MNMSQPDKVIITKPPFPHRTATISELADYYDMDRKTLMRKIKSIIHKLSDINARRDKNGKFSTGRFPVLSPREVGYVVDFMESRDKDGY